MSTSTQHISQDPIAQLLEPMLKQRLFVACSTAKATAEQILPHVADHLEYMNRLEAEGLLFGSGPFLQPGILVGDGLTILQTKTIEDARVLMENEPLVKFGLRTFNLHTWELREGQIKVILNLSTSSFSLAEPRSE